MGIEDENASVSGTSATMEDLKKMETSLNTSMEVQMNELREMIAQLMKAKDTTPSSPPENSSADDQEDKEGVEKLKINPPLKLRMGRRSTMRSLIGTHTTHLFHILI